MIHKIPNVALLVAIVVGGALAWRTGAERSRLTTTYHRLARITGDFPIEDPSKVYVQAIDTGEKGHFAWRCYYPRNYTQVVKDKGFFTTQRKSDPVEFISRVRIRENDQGQLELYARFSAGSNRMGFGDKTLADFLRDRWDEIRVEQLGAGGVAVVAPDQPAVLLRLTLPESMADEARKKLDPYVVERYVPIMLNLQLDPTAPTP